MSYYSYFQLAPIAGVGLEVARRSLGLAFGLLGSCAVIAYAFEYAGLAMPGRQGERNTLRVVVAAFGLFLLLLLYGKVIGLVSSTSASLAKNITTNSDFDAYIGALGQKITEQFSTDGKSAGELISSFTSGIISTAAAALSIVAVMIFLQLFFGLQTILFSILVATGPLVIACAILPGTSGLIGRWLTGLIELAAWPVLASIVLAMCMKAGLAQYSVDAGNWVKMLAANVLLVAALAVVPTIASRLVGQGFGAVGPIMSVVAMKGVSMVGGLRQSISNSVRANAGTVRTVGKAAAVVGRVLGKGGGHVVDAAVARRTPKNHLGNDQMARNAAIKHPVKGE